MKFITLYCQITSKEVIRSRKLKKEKITQWPNEKGQKKKQRFTKYYTEN